MKSLAIKFLAVLLVGLAFGFFIGKAHGEDTLIPAHTVFAASACLAPYGINDGSIKMLSFWMDILKKMELFLTGAGPALTQKELDWGMTADNLAICGQMNQKFQVFIVEFTATHSLFVFEPTLEFGTDKWIVLNQGLVRD
jgi:hypothetical protein